MEARGWVDLYQVAELVEKALSSREWKSLIAKSSEMIVKMDGQAEAEVERSGPKKWVEVKMGAGVKRKMGREVRDEMGPYECCGCGQEGDGVAVEV